jgi:hypothetical protein
VARRILSRMGPKSRETIYGGSVRAAAAALVTVASVAGSLTTTPAHAQRGGPYYPYYYGPSYYGGPRPAPGSDYYGPCSWQRQRFWDRSGWRVRSVKICY